MKVLIAIDGTEFSRMAIDSVVNRQWSDSTEFTVISVVEPMAAQCVGWHAAYVPAALLEAEQELKKIRRQLIDDVSKRLKQVFGDQRVSARLAHGYARDEIVEYAQQWKADLIIVGSHGRTGLSRVFLGSVAEAVAHSAKCSVEIIKGHPLSDRDAA